MSEVVFLPTKRGGKSLVYRDFIYRINIRKKDRAYWKCRNENSNCKARVTLNLKSNEVEKVHGVHNHEPETTFIESKRSKQQLKEFTSDEDLSNHQEISTFLGDPGIPSTSRSTLDINGDDVHEDISTYTEELSVNSAQRSLSGEMILKCEKSCDPAPEANATQPKPGFRRRKKEGIEAAEKRLAKNVLRAVSEHLKKNHLQEDRFDVVGKTIAMKLRSLPKQQMLLAEKIINDTLFQAEMGSLNMSNKLISEQQLYAQHLDNRYYSPGNSTVSSSGLPYKQTLQSSSRSSSQVTQLAENLPVQHPVPHSGGNNSHNVLQ